MELLLKGARTEGDDTSSPQKIQEALNTMQLVALSTSQGEKFVKVKPLTLANKIFTHLGIPMPSNISTKNDLLEHFKIIAASSAEPSSVQMTLL